MSGRQPKAEEDNGRQRKAAEDSGRQRKTVEDSRRQWKTAGIPVLQTEGAFNDVRSGKSGILKMLQEIFKGFRDAV